MTKIINHDIRSVNGKTIYLPVWKGGETNVPRDLAIPDVYVLDTVQKYPVGTKFVDGDRVFHYGYCNAIGGATVDRAMGGMFNVATAQAITAKAVIHAVGETKIVLVDATSTLNQWAGGYLMPRVHPYSYYRVLSNTATDGTNITLTLERGLITAMAASEDGFLNQNMFSKMESHLPNSSRGYSSVVGVNMVKAVTDRWMWVQTWGPCYVSGGDELVGVSIDDRDAWFHRDGTLLCPASVEQKQRAGFAINDTGAGTSTWFIYLQIAC